MNSIYKIIFCIIYCISFKFVFAQDTIKAKEFWKNGKEIMRSNSEYGIFHPDNIKLAINAYTLSIEADSNFFYAYTDRGYAYSLQNENEKALSDLKKSLSINPDYFATYNCLGMLFNNLNDYEEAKRFYYSAVTGHKETDMIIFFNLAHLYDKLEEYELSIGFYSKAIKIDSTDAPSYSNRAFTKMKSGQYEEALKDFDKAILLDSKFIGAYNNRGLNKYYMKNYTEALTDFKKVLEIDLGKIHSTIEEIQSHQKFALNNMANCYYELGDTEKACYYWNKAIEAGYIYNPDWKRVFKVEDPNKLLEIHCN